MATSPKSPSATLAQNPLSLRLYKVLAANFDDDARTGPLPDAAHPALAGQAVAAARDRDRVPVLEPDVGATQVGEEVFFFSLVHHSVQDSSGALPLRARGPERGRLLDAVVD